MFSIDVKVVEKGKKSPAWNIDTDLSGNVTLDRFLDFTKSALIGISTDVLREEQKNGFDKDPRTRVDNVFDRDESQVNPLGKIEYFSKSNFTEVILGVYKNITKRSIIGETGFYKNSNYVFFRGVLVAKSEAQLKTWTKKMESKKFVPGDIVRFLNIMPYARKLETSGHRGVKARGGSLSKKRRGKDSRGNITKLPNGAYFLAHKASKARYKSATNFLKFQFITGDAINIKSISRPGFRTNYYPAGRPYLYPSIVLDFSAAGAK